MRDQFNNFLKRTLSGFDELESIEAGWGNVVDILAKPQTFVENQRNILIF